MKKLDIYITSLHILPFLGSVLVLTVVLLIDKIFELMDLLIRKGVPLEIVSKLFIYAIPFIMALTVPMAVLIASLLAFGRLSQNFEIIAIKASGISLKRILLGPLIFSAIIFVLMVYFNDKILPEANHRFKNILIDIYIKRPIAQVKAGLFNDIGDYKLYIRSKDDRTDYIEDIRIYNISDFGRTFITAKSGYIKSIQDSIVFFQLYDGEIHELIDPFKNIYRFIHFKRYETTIKIDISLQLREREFRGDREMDSKMLLEEIKNKENQILTTKDKEIKNYLKIRVNQLVVELHKKFSLPFASIVFILLSAPLSSILRRGGIGTALGISFLVFTIYYIFLIGGEELAKKGLLNGIIAMWFPNLFFFIISIYLIFREEK